MLIKVRMVLIIWMCGCSLAMAESLTLEQAIRKVLQYYPTLKVADLRAQQANSELESIRSQLSWKLSSSVGITHDVSSLVVPYDRFDANVAMNRRLESGDSLGFSGRYQYNDDSLTLNPLLPNPSQALSFDVNYRIPLGKGEGNETYQQAVTIAEIQQRLENLNKQMVFDSLTDNVIRLFHEIENTRQRLIFTDTSINRSQRLKNYINRNRQLGIYERKDVLEAEAQLLKIQADRESLLLIASEQNNALRKLLGLSPASDIIVELGQPHEVAGSDEQILAMAEKHDPRVQANHYRLAIADARITSALNENREQKDLVFSVGSRSLYGDNTSGTVDESDYAASVRFEYAYDLGGKAYTSKIDKIKKDKEIVLEESRLNHDEVSYRVTNLVNIIRQQQSLINNLQSHKRVARAKYNDAESRHKKGRINTTDLIRFENELHAASLQLAAAQINLSSSKTQLWLLTGGFSDLFNSDGQVK